MRFPLNIQFIKCQSLRKVIDFSWLVYLTIINICTRVGTVVHKKREHNKYVRTYNWVGFWSQTK